MARTKRQRSKTGIYHVMLRGIDGRKIFLDNEDKEKFIYSMLNSKKKANYFLIGYCLMSNHVHLLIKEGPEEIGISIKRITVSYVQWHNNKYGRQGHLFQNRFRSEVVEQESYLLVVLRYIHQNPLKAKLIQNLDAYKWSSYLQYINYYNDKKTNIDVDVIASYLDNQTAFENFMNESNNDQCLDFIENNKLTDKELINEIKKKYQIKNLSSMNIYKRNKVICDIKTNTGASLRQLSRVLGIGRSIIERASRE